MKDKTGTLYRVGVETIPDYFPESSPFWYLQDGLSEIISSRYESFFPQLREFLGILHDFASEIVCNIFACSSHLKIGCFLELK